MSRAAQSHSKKIECHPTVCFQCWMLDIYFSVLAPASWSDQCSAFSRAQGINPHFGLQITQLQGNFIRDFCPISVASPMMRCVPLPSETYKVTKMNMKRSLFSEGVKKCHYEQSTFAGEEASATTYYSWYLWDWVSPKAELLWYWRSSNSSYVQKILAVGRSYVYRELYAP